MSQGWKSAKSLWNFEQLCTLRRLALQPERQCCDDPAKFAQAVMVIVCHDYCLRMNCVFLFQWKGRLNEEVFIPTECMNVAFCLAISPFVCCVTEIYHITSTWLWHPSGKKCIRQNVEQTSVICSYFCLVQDIRVWLNFPDRKVWWNRHEITSLRK